MGIIDCISLKVIGGGVEKIEYEISNLRIAILQMLCVQSFHREEGVTKTNLKKLRGEELVREDEIEFY